MKDLVMNVAATGTVSGTNSGNWAANRAGQTVTLTDVTVADGATYSVNGSDTATIAAKGAAVTTANQIVITVTAENGDQATYTLTFQIA